MNYYISGQSGFIGTALTKYLTDKGDTVHCIPRGFTIDNLIKLFKWIKPDYIIHTATYGNHYNQNNFLEIVEANIIGTYNLLEAAKGFDYKRFYNFSTSSVQLKVQTNYSITKYCGEQLASMYKNTVNIRPFSVYGPGLPKHLLIPRVIECLQTGKQMIIDENATHDWIYIDSFIEAMFNGATEIGTGVKTTNLEIIRILEEISGKKLNYITGKLKSYDNDNWVCKKGVPDIGLYEGLKRMYV